MEIFTNPGAEWIEGPLSAAKARVRIAVLSDVSTCCWATFPVHGCVKNRKINIEGELFTYLV